MLSNEHTLLSPNMTYTSSYPKNYEKKTIEYYEPNAKYLTYYFIHSAKINVPFNFRHILL